ITLFVRWIEDYPLLDGLKMPSHVGFYDRIGDPDNYLHIFEGAIRMQKWAMHVARHMFTYSLKDSAWIWWNGQKAVDTLQILRLHKEQRISGFVHGLRTRSLVEFLFTDLPITYKGLIKKTYTWNEAKEVASNRAPNDHKEGFDRFNKGCSWDNIKGKKKNHDRFSPYKGTNHGLLINLSKSPREILATEKVAKTFTQPPRNVENRRSRDMSKYCHFHEDHAHETNQCRELRH
ncbi:hypothetical protein Tco_1232356, partial [Tanacetum coccineum]